MKELKFEDFINYDKRIGKMLIAGDEGTGKTLLLCKIGKGKMLHGFWDCCKSYDEVNEYNRLGYNFSKNYEHLCFANFDINCKGTEIPGRRVYSFNPYRLGFYDPNYITDFFPPFSLFCMTEGKNFLDSYEWNKFPNRYVSWLKTMRQARYDMVVDSQAFGDICTAYKKITNRFIYLHKECEEIKDGKGNVVGHKLFVFEFKHLRDVEYFERTTKKQNCDEYILIINDDFLYRNYDSRYCKYLHLKGRENQDFRIKHFPEIKTLDDVDNFAEEFGYTVPEGFYKSKNKDKKSLDDDLNELDNDLNFDDEIIF